MVHYIQVALLPKDVKDFQGGRIASSVFKLISINVDPLVQLLEQPNFKFQCSTAVSLLRRNRSMRQISNRVKVKSIIDK